MRVLYVDDDRINTLLFVETCRMAGEVEVEVAGTGAEALDLVAGWQPQLLVVDLHLPDTTGYALLPQLRQALGRPALPAVLWSADDVNPLRAPARAAASSTSQRDCSSCTSTTNPPSGPREMRPATAPWSLRMMMSGPGSTP